MYDMKELDKNMYFGAKAVTIETAKQLRNNMTYHENQFWKNLKASRFAESVSEDNNLLSFS
jgi:very-short-patch-repair endonuclease